MKKKNRITRVPPVTRFTSLCRYGSVAVVPALWLSPIFFSSVLHWFCVLPAIGTGLTFFQRLALVSYFSRAFHWFHVFPVLCTSFMFFPRFALVSCFSRTLHLFPVFPAFCTGVKLFPRFAVVSSFTRLTKGRMAYHTWFGTADRLTEYLHLGFS